MILFIAEKPSMGAELAKCLTPPLKRGDGYIKTRDAVVTWGFGHILRQAEPEEYDVKYKRWQMEDLPIIPQQWKLLVDKACAKQFETIKRLIDAADEIVHAGDPDREGQLLIDEILDYVGNTKPVKRILLNALDETSIKKALTRLKDNSEFMNLKQSALARARADWLIGMNLSRAYTLAVRRAGYNVVLPIGRVKTPTLALVVRRERELKTFVPTEYYGVKAEFEHTGGIVPAVWQIPEDMAGLDAHGRLVEFKAAQAFVDELSAADGVARIARCETVRKRETPRLPFSLSALQLAAGKQFGYEPQQVLDTLQRLYEKKFTTYPRSDCEFLPQNQFADAPAILNNLSQFGSAELAALVGGADFTLKSRAWNDKKITAHHAIIPTLAQCRAATLNEIERNLYELIARSYIAQFYPPYVYDHTKIEIEYCGAVFAAGGRVVKDQGWKAVYDDADSDSAKQDGDVILPAVRTGDRVVYKTAAVDKKTTKPPPRFTQATLLGGMKDIHKYVKNSEAKKKLKAVCGIGTEATRATIIKELVERGFLQHEKKKKTLTPTQAAYLMIDCLPEAITYPDYTALWEETLYLMSQGEASLDQFLLEQIAFTGDLCRKADAVAVPPNGEYVCPVCKRGALIRRQGRNGYFWGCSDYPRCKGSMDDVDGKPRADRPTIMCPRCKQGQLRRLNGRNGVFWGCRGYPACTATFNDVNGTPEM